LKEGIVTTQDQKEKEDIGKLLRFETSKSGENNKIGLDDYLKNLKENQKDVYYLAAPSRQLALTSPYYESLKKVKSVKFKFHFYNHLSFVHQQDDYEVLFCYEPYDELVLMQLISFKNHSLVSVEKEIRRANTVEEGDKLFEENLTDTKESLSKKDTNDLISFLKKELGNKVQNVKYTTKLDQHPCVVTVEDMASARHFIKTQSHQLTEDNRYALLQSQLEINPK
jgi:TNF receptor-associated protein 1